VRAILKADDLCAKRPERAARRPVDGGFRNCHEYELQTLRENSDDNDGSMTPEDTGPTPVSGRRSSPSAYIVKGWSTAPGRDPRYGPFRVR
jgi:hypothetical protein